MLRVPKTPESTAPSSRTDTGAGSRIRRPGSAAGVLKAMYTGPFTGVVWSGESIVAVPTRELSGQLLAFDASREHARCAPGRLGCSARGRITSARLSAASSGSNLSVVLTGGNSCSLVTPGAPIDPSAVGEKPSESQPVGVILNSFWENAVGASQEFARLTELPCAQEVGMRMNAPLLPRALNVSATLVIWTGTPAVRGWSAKVDSRPYPSGPARTKTGA